MGGRGSKSARGTSSYRSVVEVGAGGGGGASGEPAEGIPDKQGPNDAFVSSPRSVDGTIGKAEDTMRHTESDLARGRLSRQGMSNLKERIAHVRLHQKFNESIAVAHPKGSPIGRAGAAGAAKLRAVGDKMTARFNEIKTLRAKQ